VTTQSNPKFDFNINIVTRTKLSSALTSANFTTISQTINQFEILSSLEIAYTKEKEAK